VFILKSSAEFYIRNLETETQVVSLQKFGSDNL